MRPISIALLVFCAAYLIRAEWLVYQHYLIINRDYYPIMSEFYRMYAERAAGFVGQASAIWLGMQSKQFNATQTA
jgi:hypothetical protein